MVRYVNGMYIERKDFDNGGMILKCSLNMTKLYEENPTNEKGYLNINIKFNKEGKPYGVINEFYHKESTQKEEENVVNFDEISEDEIPF